MTDLGLCDGLPEMRLWFYSGQRIHAGHGAVWMAQVFRDALLRDYLPRLQADSWTREMMPLKIMLAIV